MSLRKLFLGAFALSLLALTLVLGFQIHGVIEDGFQTYRSEQIPRVQEYVNAVINSRQEKLEAIMGVIQSINRVDRERLLKKADIAFVEEISPSFSHGIPDDVVQTALSHAAGDQPTFGLSTWKGNPLLFIYQKRGGHTFVAGYAMEETLTKRISELTLSKVDFLLVPRGETPSNTHILRDWNGPKLAMTVEPSRSLFEMLSKTLLTELLLAGVIALVFSFGVFFVLLNSLFLKRFHKNLDEIHKASESLKRGELPTLSFGPAVTVEESRLLSSVTEMSDSLEEYDAKLRSEVEKKSELEKTNAMNEFIRNIAHDIRSPVAALEMLVETIREIPKAKQKVMLDCTDRIKKVAQTIRNNKSAPEESEFLSAELLAPLLRSLITEKKYQYREKNLELVFVPQPGAENLSAVIIRSQLQRSLSNIIDNAVEACGDDGRIKLRLQQMQDSAIIRVEDNGHGIPRAILPKIGERGFTFGKEQGAGLGLNYAMFMIRAIGGKVNITSNDARGTEVEITLPLAQSDANDIQFISLEPGQTVVVIDDEPIVHDFWDSKFKKLISRKKTHVVHLNTPNEFRKWLAAHPIEAATALFLCDHQFGKIRETGFECIEDLKVASQSVLITSAAINPSLQEKCKTLGLRLLDKDVLTSLEIKLIHQKDDSSLKETA